MTFERTMSVFLGVCTLLLVVVAVWGIWTSVVTYDDRWVCRPVPSGAAWTTSCGWESE